MSGYFCGVDNALVSVIRRLLQNGFVFVLIFTVPVPLADVGVLRNWLCSTAKDQSPALSTGPSPGCHKLLCSCSMDGGAPLGVGIKGYFNFLLHILEKIFFQESRITSIFRKIPISFPRKKSPIETNANLGKPYASVFGARGRQPSTLSAQEQESQTADQLYVLHSSSTQTFSQVYGHASPNIPNL